MAERFITCDDCQTEFVLDPQQRADGQRIEVGFACPMCHHWFHSYWTTPKLEKLKAKLAEAKQGGHQKAMKKVTKKYQRLFLSLNPRLRGTSG